MNALEILLHEFKRVPIRVGEEAQPAVIIHRYHPLLQPKGIQLFELLIKIRNMKSDVTPVAQWR